MVRPGPAALRVLGFLDSGVSVREQLIDFAPFSLT